MTTQEYLGQIELCNKRIQNKLSEIYQLKMLLCNVSAANDDVRVQTSSDNDRLGSGIAKIVDMEKTIDKMIDEYINIRGHIITQIDSVENVDYYHVLSLRYVGENTFAEIAEKTHWSIRKVFDLHNKALKEFEIMYGNTYLNKCVQQFA